MLQFLSQKPFFFSIKPYFDLTDIYSILNKLKMQLHSVFLAMITIKVKNDHRSKFSNLSNWKEEAWKNQGFNGIRTRDLRDTDVAEVTGSNPVKALIFFRLLLSNRLNWKIYCDDHSSHWSTTAVQIYELFHIYLTSMITIIRQTIKN